jgi:hypothetical protein
MLCSIFILVTNPAEQHNMAPLKQSSEANKPSQRDESSLVRFEKFQGRLPFTRSPLLQVSPVQCAQSRYFIATPFMSFSRENFAERSRENRTELAATAEPLCGGTRT